MCDNWKVGMSVAGDSDNLKAITGKKGVMKVTT